ncbi:TauD/TfdA family dioxygenase [Paracraurococcus lichenis]|uniref:TauD/TfdA family dioxygenase n=1 Tax=Paracraurococcus lichenis TaxID=3064888 RepID=A0ABT9E079_9PROT|nr:TauD/TfdA family dioxygenase [Paracraurococcus sp. LOR1-02]MDO9709569.1 TauD/TfdA family dioxygenase [Paracraurococcus sp. LOR1-02]
MTPPLRLVPQAGPSVWTGAALTPSDWMVPIGAEAAAEIEAALVALAGRPPGGPADAPLPGLAPVLRGIAERLEHGRGFALLRGLDLARFAGPATEAALLVLGAHLGTALAQDEAGALVGRLAGPGTGAEAPARFHADPADAVALLCLRQTREGGRVTLVSAPALHNALLKSDRAALTALHAGLPHRNGGGEPLHIPVFSTASGSFVGRYDRDAMLEEALEEAQRDALAALDAAAAAAGQALTLALHAGDILFLNPHLVWKQVLAGEVPAADEASRELLRLWLATPGSRALPESFGAVFGTTAAGAPRGGVPVAGGMVGG